jgi:putative endonuclease
VSFGWARQRVRARRRRLSLSFSCRELRPSPAEARSAKADGQASESLANAGAAQVIEPAQQNSSYAHAVGGRSNCDVWPIERYFPGKLGGWSSCTPRVVTIHQRSVYVLRSIRYPARYYIGLTTDVATRLAVHNSGGSAYTADLRPWELVATIEFTNETSAVAFEKYLKSGSGRAFAKRHFV